MTSGDTELRSAHDAGYHFPYGFSGFSASVRTGDGHSGTLTVRGRDSVELAIDGASAELDWAREQLRSMVGHRWPVSYEQGDGRFGKRLDGDTVKLLDDPYESSYRLRDQTISEVHRTVGDSRFVISVRERVPTNDGRWLPAHFSVYYWSAGTGRLVRAEHVVDAYTEVDGVYLPAKRETVTASDEGLVRRSIELTGHKVRTDG